MATLTAGDPYVSNFEALHALRHSQDMLSAGDVYDDLKARSRNGGRRSRKRKRKATTPARSIQQRAVAYLEESPAGSQTEAAVCGAVRALKKFEKEINASKVGSGGGGSGGSGGSGGVDASDLKIALGRDGVGQRKEGGEEEGEAADGAKFEFTRSEILMVLALRPKSQATLNLIVEECEERLDEAQCEQLQGVVEAALPVR